MRQKMDGLFKVGVPVLTLILLCIQSIHSIRSEELRCERIVIPMCRNVKYNMTSMPNRFHHETQEEAGLEVHQFLPLVKIGCSSLLTEFLCSAYFPICMDNYPKPIVPCRTLCQQVRNGCERLMMANGFSWPENLECSLFPEVGDDQNLCLDLKPELEPEPKEPKFFEPATKTSEMPPSQTDDVCTCSCPTPNLMTLGLTSVNFGGIEGCQPACRSGLVEQEEREAVSWWIGSWTIICIICTMFILLTFLIDRHRFKYPERPLVIIAFCYFMVALGFAFRLFAGHESISCDGPVSRQGVSGPAPCIVTFLLLYFFGMASCMWWVILSFTWLLTSRFRWSTEAITSHSTKLHFIAWAVPSIQTIAVLATSSVDGDAVAGVCFVGHHSTKNLIFFVVIPLAVYLSIGIVFLFSGLISMVWIRKAIEMQPGHVDSEKLRRLKAQRKRIGLYAFSTVLPHAALLACHLYEVQYREEWDKSLTCQCQETTVKPFLMVFMIKYLCMLIIGITSCLWLIGRKTLDAWKKVCCHGCMRKSSSTKSSDIDLIKSCHSVSIPRYQKSSYPVCNV